MRHPRFSVLLASLLLFVGVIPVQVMAESEVSMAKPESSAEANPAAADQLSHKLSRLETFSADFVQFIVDKAGAAVQQTSGRLKAKRPGRFYWYTAPPLEQFVKSDDEEVWVYDPDLEQVTVHKKDANASTTPSVLLSGDIAKLDASYLVDYVRSDGVETFMLKPKGEDSLFESLKLRFVDDVLVEMRLTDGLGQKTTLSFSNVVTNKVLTDADFELNLPEGVDIIRE